MFENPNIVEGNAITTLVTVIFMEIAEKYLCDLPIFQILSPQICWVSFISVLPADLLDELLTWTNYLSSYWAIVTRSWKLVEMFGMNRQTLLNMGCALWDRVARAFQWDVAVFLHRPGLMRGWLLPARRHAPCTALLRMRLLLLPVCRKRCNQSSLYIISIYVYIKLCTAHKALAGTHFACLFLFVFVTDLLSFYPISVWYVTACIIISPHFPGIFWCLFGSTWRTNNENIWACSMKGTGFRINMEILASSTSVEYVYVTCLPTCSLLSLKNIHLRRLMTISAALYISLIYVSVYNNISLSKRTV